MGHGRRALGMLGGLALAQVGWAAGCVDGVTPDCSTAASQCGPSLDSGDAQADRAEGAADAPQDTNADALDAGDEAS